MYKYIFKALMKYKHLKVNKNKNIYHKKKKKLKANDKNTINLNKHTRHFSAKHTQLGTYTTSKY